MKLTDIEKRNLKVLREEEKLARDVYRYAYKKYRLPIFNNISKSEQWHMDKVLDLLINYNLEDPVTPQEGVFNNEELQKLYNDLTAKVDISLLDALNVGATIEDLDIYDIMEFKKETSRPDILDTYKKLECGSRNHLRSFYLQINRYKQDYTPQYIPISYFNEIIHSGKERCGWI